MKSKKYDESTGSYYWHLVYFALAYSALVIVCTVGSASGRRGIPFLLVPLLSVMVATMVLVAIWSVFGTGSYFRRLLWAHLVGGIVGLGLLLSILILMLSQNALLGESFAPILVAIISIPPLSMAAQLPFWIFRGFFGWQFVLGDQPPVESYTLRDIFTLTFAFALSFAAPQFAVNLSGMSNTAADLQNPTVRVVQSDGSVRYQAAETDEEILGARRQMAESIREGVLFGYVCASVYAIVLSVLCLPIFLFIFRLQETGIGCFSAGVYSVFVCLLPLGLALVLSGLNQGLYFVFYAVSLTVGVGACLAIPMFVSRVSGFRLTSPKIYAQSQLDAEAARMGSLVEEVEVLGHDDSEIQ